MTTTDSRQTPATTDGGRPPIGAGRKRQGAIYQAGVLGRAPSVPVDPTLLEQAAHRAMSDKARAYVEGGAGSGATMRHNRDAFERWRIVPRMLHGTTSRDLSTTVLGTDLRSPVLLAPVGAGALVKARQRRAHRQRRGGRADVVRLLLAGLQPDGGHGTLDG